MRLILIFIVLMSHFLYAEQNDFTQPITIKSVSQFVDGLNDVAVYKDNVVITQGSLNITADEVRMMPVLEMVMKYSLRWVAGVF